jgi:hypothetical protein
MDDRKAYSAGAALCYLAKSAAWRTKNAIANGELAYDLEGKLYLSESGYLLLSVPNAIGQGAFDALNVHGAELPTSNGRYNAHITVMRPEEIATIPGGGNAISERGHTFTYTTGPVRTFVPSYRTGNWVDVSRVWIIEIRSPDLERLRKSYGLSPLPKNNEYRFHVTFALRRSKILQENEKSKAAVSLIHSPEEFQRRAAAAFQTGSPESAPAAEQATRAKEAGNPYAIQKSGIHGDGVFAGRSLEEGFDLGPALIEERKADSQTGDRGRAFRRTDIGRYVNHSEKPNAILVQKEDCFHLVTDEPVSAGAEITSNYHDVYDVIGHDATFDKGTAGRDPFLGPPRRSRKERDDSDDASDTEQERGFQDQRSVGEGAERSQGTESAASQGPGDQTDHAPFGKWAAQNGSPPRELQGRPVWLALIAGAGADAVEGNPERHGRLGGLSRSKVADINADIDAAAAECEEPKSKEQAEAGNYRHGHCRLHGMGITIETGKGMTRKGTDKSGKSWSIELKNSYGYIKRTQSEADGDHIDVFLNDGDVEHELVFIVDQVKADTGNFDEHKVMLGFPDQESAKAAYFANYSKGWKGFGGITPITLPDFKWWIHNGDTSKPYAAQARATRNDKLAGVRGLAGHEDTLLLPERHQLQGLRGQGDSGLQGLATKFSGVLSGYGSVSERHDARSPQLQTALHTIELSLGDAVAAGAQPFHKSGTTIPRGTQNADRVGRGVPPADKYAVDANLSLSVVAGESTDNRGRNQKQGGASQAHAGRQDTINSGLGTRERFGIGNDKSTTAAGLVPTQVATDAETSQELFHGFPNCNLTFKQKAAASALSSLGVGTLCEATGQRPKAAATTNTASCDTNGDATTPIDANRQRSQRLRLLIDEMTAEFPEFQKSADLLPDVQLQPQQSRVADPAAHQAVRKLLFHSLGSGKTLASIATAETAGGPYVASVPAALRPNFRKEQERFTDQTTPNRVQSYNALAKGVPEGQIDTAIFDEAHRLRNPEAKQTQNAKLLAAKAKNVLMLSGSPIVNRPSDLAAMIEMLTQQPMSPEDFDAKFVGKEKVNPGLGGWIRGVKPVEQTVIKNEDDLRELLGGHVDYHQPTNPGVEQVEERYTVPMSSEQEALHQSFWDQLPWLLRWKLKNQFPLTNEETRSMSSFLAGPRQVGLSTLPFMKGNRDPMKAFRQSPKLQKAMELSRETLKDPNAKVVAFSNFIEAGLEPYAAALAAEKIPHAMFHGGLTDAERKQIVEDYNAGKLRQLLLGPSAAEGISLKGTSALQLLDPHWNEARSNQAIGRGIRYDSHTHLPEELRKVRTQRFVSELPAGFVSKMWRKLIQTKPSTSMNDPGTDTYLENMARRKSELNEQFLQLLREVGTQEKTADDNLTIARLGAAGDDLRGPQDVPGFASGAPVSQRDLHDGRDGAIAAASVPSGRPAGAGGRPLDQGPVQNVLRHADSLGRDGVQPGEIDVLAILKRAKALSDRGDYAGKQQLLRGLMQESPADWLIDSNATGKFPGVTHKPTGFRLHTLRTTIPSNVSA